MENKKKYYLFTMKLSDLNILSIILLITMVLLTFIIYKVFNLEFNIALNNKNLVIILLTYLIFAIFHEILHFISYVLYGADHNNISFGIHLEKGILCCLCKQNITRKNILNSLLFPFFYLGIVTYIIGLILNNDLLTILSILNISGCSGDLIMFKFFIKLKDIEYSEFDNPIAFALYTNEDLSSKKPYGLKYIETRESLERTTKQKISVSKKSYIFIICLIILSIILSLY